MRPVDSPKALISGLAKAVTDEKACPEIFEPSFGVDELEAHIQNDPNKVVARIKPL
ncbi:MAG: hypothetical protein N2376_00930 [Clostridia bacterium]|nr:hypothetical protein [Clostridia bacterium]